MKYDIIVANVAGLVSKKEILQNEMAKISPMIMALTETHITEHLHEKLYDLSEIGYYNITVMSHSNKTGGVTIYLKNYIQYEIIKEESDNVMWCLMIKVKNLSKNLIIGVFYRSPSAPKKIQIQKMMEWFKFLDPYKKEYVIIIAGDANIDLSDETSYSKQVEELLHQECIKL